MAKKKAFWEDPQYLMDMRRPVFIGARSMSIFTRKLKGEAVVWAFEDVIKTTLQYINSRPTAPMLTLPQNVGDTYSPSITAVERKQTPLAYLGQAPKILKKLKRKVRPW